MRVSHSIVVALLFVLGIVFTATPAQAATKKEEAKVEAVDPLKAATVNLYCTFRSGNKRFAASGSGVFVSERGVILTNAHVAQYFLLPRKEGKVTGSCSVRTGSPAKDQYTASVLYISPKWFAGSPTSPTGTGEYDFALLYVTDAKKGSLPSLFPKLPIEVAESPRVTDGVTIAGYPTEKLSSDAVRKKLKISAASSTVTNVRNFTPHVLADVLTIAPSTANAHGVSGGPIINSQGEVIGLATAVSSGKTDRTLRAVSLPYINRTLQAETYLPLNYLFIGDFTQRANSTKASVSTTTLQTIRDSMFKRK